MGHYHSVSSAISARITNQRLAAERARHAGRQTAHDAAASARAAEKRAQKRHAIANRPRGRTEAIGHLADGRPIYRAIPAFRARPYTPPADRKERPEPTIVAVNGWRYNVRPTSERIAAALKAEAPQVDRFERRAIAMHTPGFEKAEIDRAQRRIARVYTKPAARRALMAAKRRRGW